MPRVVSVFVLLPLIVSCAGPQPGPPTWIETGFEIWVLSPADGSRRAIAFEQGSGTGMAQGLEAGLQIQVHRYTGSLAELSLSPGPLELGEGRPLPQAAQIWASTFDGAALEWSALDVNDDRNRLSLPPLDGLACVTGGGCIDQHRGFYSCGSCAPTAPLPPTPPERPRFSPCPPDWSAADGACLPPPRITCTAGAFQPYGSLACRPILPCPVGRRFADPPIGVNAVYLADDAAPAGLGTEAAPYATFAEAQATIAIGDAVLFDGHFTLSSDQIAPGVSLIGSCPEHALLSMSDDRALLDAARYQGLSLEGREIFIRGPQVTIEGVSFAFEALTFDAIAAALDSVLFIGRAAPLPHANRPRRPGSFSLQDGVFQNSYLEVQADQNLLLRVVVEPWDGVAPRIVSSRGTLTIDGADLSGSASAPGIDAQHATLTARDLVLRAEGAGQTPAIYCDDEQVALERVYIRGGAGPQLISSSSHVSDLVVVADGAGLAAHGGTGLAAERLSIQARSGVVADDVGGQLEDLTLDVFSIALSAHCGGDVCDRLDVRRVSASTQEAMGGDNLSFQNRTLVLEDATLDVDHIVFATAQLARCDVQLGPRQLAAVSLSGNDVRLQRGMIGFEIESSLTLESFLIERAGTAISMGANARKLELSDGRITDAGVGVSFPALLGDPGSAGWMKRVLFERDAVPITPRN